MRFERRAHAYDRHALPQGEVVRRLAARIPEATIPTDALELGAGTGALTHHLVAKGYRVRATDISPAMLTVGRAQVPEAAWETLDAWYPPAGDTDLLCSANVLQWSPDPEATLRRHRDALRPGGVMHHAIFVTPTLPELLALTTMPAPTRQLSADDWLALAARAGLRVRTHEILTLRREHPDALALLRELHGTGAVADTGALGPGRMKALLHDYREKFPDGRGGVVSTWTSLIFEAEPA